MWCRCHHRYPLEEPRPTPIGRGFSLTTASAPVRTGWPSSYEILICFDCESMIKFHRLGPLARAGGLPEFRIFAESESIRKPRRARFCWRADFQAVIGRTPVATFPWVTSGPPGATRSLPLRRTRVNRIGVSRRDEFPCRRSPANLGNGFRRNRSHGCPRWVGADLRRPVWKSRELF